MRCRSCGRDNDDCIQYLLGHFRLNGFALTRCNQKLQEHGHKGSIQIVNNRYHYVAFVPPKVEESKPEPEVIIEPTLEPEQVIDSPIEPMPEPKKLKPKDSFR